MNEFITKYENLFDRYVPGIIPLFSRLSLFIVYFWFGATKLFTISSANALVAALLDKTMPFIPFDIFILFLGFGEMMIGLLLLIPRYSKIMFGVVVIHVIMTMMPLALLPDISWESFLNPTLEGQYMIKNLVLVSLAGMLALHSQKNKR